MATAEHFPLYQPGEVRRVFGAEEVYLRLAILAEWNDSSRLLELGPGSASLVLAGRIGCHATVVDPDDQVLTPIRERTRTAPLSDRIQVQRASAHQLPFEDEAFDGILSLGQVPLSVSQALPSMRKLLAPRGRLAFTYPVKVGRHPLKAALDHWEKKLGEPLVYPREYLQLFEQAGFEPESLETLGDADLDAYYRDLEATLARDDAGPAEQVKTLREEIELHRSQAGKASVTLALAVGRRKEPGEKPPASRDGG